MANLGSVHTRRDRHDAALKIDLEVLDSRTRVLGPEHPDTLNSMTDIGIDLAKLQRLEEAEAMHSKTVAISSRVLGSRHPTTLWSVYNLGSVAALRGNLRAALGHLRDAVEGGFAPPQQMMGDSDLAALRGMHEFKAILEIARKNQVGEQPGRDGP